MICGRPRNRVRSVEWGTERRRSQQKSSSSSSGILNITPRRKGTLILLREDFKSKEELVGGGLSRTMRATTLLTRKSILKVYLIPFLSLWIRTARSPIALMGGTHSFSALCLGNLSRPLFLTTRGRSGLLVCLLGSLQASLSLLRK